MPEVFHEDLAEMIGCSRPMVSRLMAQMIESGLLARRARQYVLLNKWDFGDDNRNSQRSVSRNGGLHHERDGVTPRGFAQADARLPLEVPSSLCRAAAAG